MSNPEQLSPQPDIRITGSPTDEEAAAALVALLSAQQALAHERARQEAEAAQPIWTAQRRQQIIRRLANYGAAQLQALRRFR